MNALIIHPTDNVAVVTAPIRAGGCVCCLQQGREVRLTAAEEKDGEERKRRFGA